MYTHPGRVIRERYTNRQKGQTLEGLVLVGDINVILMRKGVELIVYYFFHGEFSDIEFFASWSYVNVLEEGPE